MRFGIIGTNWITDRFMKAAKQHEEFSIGAVYSRTAEKGEQFAKKYDVEHVFTNMESMFQSGTIDAVYIASPNAFHAEQSILAMRNGIHVLCEKPAVTSVEEMDQVVDAANKYQVTFMEAMKSTVTPAFRQVKENLYKIGALRRIVFHYNQYSSRYDKYKEGIIENAFKPELGNGAGMDLGLYSLAPLVHLVDEPKSFVKNNYELSTGAVGQGSMLLRYETFEAIVMYSKITDSYSPNEIQGEDGVIEIDYISKPNNVHIRYRDGKIEDISAKQPFDTMYYEVEEFINTVKKGKTESVINTHDRTRKVIKLLTTD